MELIRNREVEFASWKLYKGSSEFRRDWMCHAKARLQNIIELCTEHEVLEHLYNSQVHRIFQQKLDEDTLERLMDLFERQMGKAKHLPKAKLYPCLLALCDEQIGKMSTRVSMMVDSDIAGGSSAQARGVGGGGGGVGGVGGVGGGGSGNSWRSKGNQGTHATSHKDGRNQSGTPPVNPEQCVFCPKSHPFLFYCEVFIKSRVKDRYQMVLKQKSCMRCLSMSTILDGRKVMA
jgi:hypothetical protein